MKCNRCAGRLILENEITYKGKEYYVKCINCGYRSYDIQKLINQFSNSISKVKKSEDRRKLPRILTSTRKGRKSFTKQSKYRQSKINSGRCPHCGEVCTPYYECEERRNYKRIKRLKHG